jgi:hypothetical protein
MNAQREPTVFVAHLDDRNSMKDFTAAKEFGTMREVFGKVSRNYNTSAFIEHARRVMADYREGDSILMLGDPVLCAVCVAAAIEAAGEECDIVTLSWDRMTYKYIPRHWDFGFYEFNNGEDSENG